MSVRGALEARDERGRLRSVWRWAAAAPTGGPATAARARARSAGVSQSGPRRRACPARPPGGSRATAAGRAPGAATSGRRRRPAAARSAAVRHTPSRYWSRPPSSTTRTPSPVSRGAELADQRAGEERQVAGEHGDDVGGRPRRGRPAARRRGRRRAAARGPDARPAGTGWGGPTTIRCSASATAASTVASIGAPADLAAAAWPGRRAGPPGRRPARRRCTAAAAPRRHRRAAWVPSCPWDESPAGHRCCASAGAQHTTRPDTVAAEEPLEIRLAGTPLAVTMRTPGDDFDLVHGFLATEGVIAGPDDVAGAAVLRLRRRRRPQHLQRRGRRPGARRADPRHRRWSGTSTRRARAASAARRASTRSARRRATTSPATALRLPLEVLLGAARPAARGPGGVRQDRRAARGRAVHRRPASWSRCARTSAGTTPSTRSSGTASARAGCRWPGTC